LWCSAKVDGGSQDCLTVERPYHESGLTNMAKIFLTFLILAILLIFFLLYSLRRAGRRRKPSKTLSRPTIEEDAHSLGDQATTYSPYQISPTINSSPTSDTLRSRPYNPFTDPPESSPVTWTSNQPLLDRDGAYTINMTESPSDGAITRTISGRSSIAPSFQSSQNETIATMATVQSSGSSRGTADDTASEASSSAYDTRSTQFFPVRIPAGTALWGKGASRNPFV
jgi:hypothetical protein